MEPKDFYFQLVEDVNSDPPAYFLITSKKYYDTEGCISDESGVADEVLPQGFGELMESHYEFDGTPQLGRDILLNIGMTEINFGLAAGEPVREGGDEEYDEGQDYGDEEDDEQDLDALLNNGEVSMKSFDYKNLSTDQLIRHRKVMVNNEDYMEAAKIQKELDSRD
ncbi:MAG TPA: hypothetical protein VMX17_14620 [Candidatus Glassbacteria bacterium]|nr:hypothetical protein [Candidatus Glassbacteria bacterium]